MEEEKAEAEKVDAEILRKKAELENERKIAEMEILRKNSEAENEREKTKMAEVAELERKNKKGEQDQNRNLVFPVILENPPTNQTEQHFPNFVQTNSDEINQEIFFTKELNSDEKTQKIVLPEQKNEHHLPNLVIKPNFEEKNLKIFLSKDEQELDEMLRVLESKNSSRSPATSRLLSAHKIHSSFRNSRSSRSPVSRSGSSRSPRSLRHSRSASNISEPLDTPKRLKRGISVSRPSGECLSSRDNSTSSTPTLSPKGYHSQSSNSLGAPMLNMTYAHPRIPLAPLQVSRERSFSSSTGENGVAVILDLPSSEKKILEDFFNSLGLPIAHIFFKEALDLNTIMAWEDPEKQLKQLGIVQKGAIFRIVKGLENLKRSSHFDPAYYGRPISLSDARLYNRPEHQRGRAATTAFTPRDVKTPTFDAIPEGPVIAIKLGFLEARVTLVKEAISTVLRARGVDLYVRCDVRKDQNIMCQYRNKSIPKTLNPSWETEEPLPMSIFNVPEGGSIHIEIWDESAVGDSKVAETVWTWEKIGYLRNGRVWVPLKFCGECAGELNLIITEKVEHVVEYRWSPDILGEEFESFSFSLNEDTSGPQSGTLIRRISDSDTTTAVLYIHDFSDYFWNMEIGINFTQEGYHFYALDLRKYGRNFIPENNSGPNSVKNIMEYYEEIHLVVEFIRKVEGIEKLLLCGSGLGGLIATLFTADHPQGIDGLCLLSPMFSLNSHWDSFLQNSQNWFGTKDPNYQDTQFSLQYHQSLHRSHYGEHEWDLTLKPLGGFPITVLWVQMVQEAQKRVMSGTLNLGVPILVLCAQQSVVVKGWSEDVKRGDVLLTVEGIVAVAAKLGRCVKTQLVQNGIHDVLLSCKNAREESFDMIFEYFLWMVDDEFKHPDEVME